VKTYDPKKYVLTFAGIPLNKGVADGTFLSVASSAPGFSKKVGVDGEVTRARSHDRTATATITLMQTSEVNDRLSARYRADRNAVNGQGVGAFEVRDLAGTTIARAAKAWISDDPDLTLEAEASTREWTIDLADWDPLHGSVSDD
jgi:hypothetical protein